MQGKIDRLASSMEELETKLVEMTTRNEVLVTQHDNEARKCHLIKVISSFHHLMIV